MGNASRLQAARARARERRAAMDAERARRDARIDAAATMVFTGTAAKEDAEQARHDAEQTIGQGLTELLQEGLSTAQAAQLCELSTGEVQRLTRRHRQAAKDGSATPTLNALPPAAPSALPEPAALPERAAGRPQVP